MTFKCRAILLLFCLRVGCTQAETLSQLSESFWAWRAQEQPFSEDDIPRIERPHNMVIDWSRQTIGTRREQLASFERRWKLLAPTPGTIISQQVDYRLLGSALARVRWELDIQRGWKCNPEFYVDQTLGAV